jgi:hypothetical protein
MSMNTQYGHADAWGINMDLQYGHGHASWTWSRRVDMQHGHRHEVWTWTCNMGMDITLSLDLDVQPGLGYAVCLFPCCMFMSMLQVNAHAACQCPCCMSMTMLHVHDHAACPCPCCMSMSMHVQFIKFENPLIFVSPLI